MLYKRQATTFIPCPPLELFSKILLFIVPPNYEMGFSPLDLGTNIPQCVELEIEKTENIHLPAFW